MPTRHLIAAVLLTVLGPTAASAEPTPAGGEATLPGGDCPSIAGRPDGTFALAWRHGFPGGMDLMVEAGDLDGGGFGPLHSVRVEGNHYYGRTAVAATPDGYTVAVKHGNGERAPHLALTTDLGGAPLGEVQDLGRDAIELSPRPVGGFVTHWFGQDHGILNVQVLSAAGRPAAPPVRLRVARGYGAQVTHRPSGELVVYWYQVSLGPGTLSSVSARRFDAGGRPVGPAFRLASFRNLWTSPSFLVAVGPDGTLAAAWSFAPNEGVGREGVRVRLFSPTGQPRGPVHELIGAAARSDLVFWPQALAVDGQGRAFAIASELDADRWRAHALALLPTGAADGAAFELTDGTGLDHLVCAAVAPVGNVWLAAWRRDDDGGTFSTIVVRGFSR